MPTDSDMLDTKVSSENEYSDQLFVGSVGPPRRHTFLIVVAFSLLAAMMIVKYCPFLISDNRSDLETHACYDWPAALSLKGR
jgi:hypothetical protein